MHEVTDTLLNYLDYNGQELWAYPFLRYSWTIYPSIGSDYHGLYPYHPDCQPFMIRAFGKYGKNVHAILNLHGMPEFKRQNWRKDEWLNKGYLRLSPFGELLRGSVSGSANMLVPEVEKLFLNHLETVRALGMETVSAEDSMAKTKAILETGCFSAAHTQMFSAAWHRLKLVTADKENMKKIAAMFKQNTLRVNCGTSDFYLARDGRLFAPDASFAEGRGYGFTGRSWNFCTRVVDGVKSDANTTLFVTEVYNIDSYKVKLANGEYKVKCYMRWGYAPSFNKPNSFLKATVVVGKETRIIDFKKDLKGSMNNTLVFDFRNVPVANGILEIKFPAGGDCRLLNAIEVIPEK